MLIDALLDPIAGPRIALFVLGVILCVIYIFAAEDFRRERLRRYELRRKLGWTSPLDRQP